MESTLAPIGNCAYPWRGSTMYRFVIAKETPHGMVAWDNHFDDDPGREPFIFRCDSPDDLLDTLQLVRSHYGDQSWFIGRLA
jgi:hypothetical protein